mmetsp:Transcript_119635/g.345847  ORF Transcript_119635/g.345847 Transcript_119635/m.345847 type:complete len:361 (+) Transcript_119635:310-1392(+)
MDQLLALGWNTDVGADPRGHGQHEVGGRIESRVGQNRCSAGCCDSEWRGSGRNSKPKAPHKCRTALAVVPAPSPRRRRDGCDAAAANPLQASRGHGLGAARDRDRRLADACRSRLDSTRLRSAHRRANDLGRHRSDFKRRLGRFAARAELGVVRRGPYGGGGDEGPGVDHENIQRRIHERTADQIAPEGLDRRLLDLPRAIEDCHDLAAAVAVWRGVRHRLRLLSAARRPASVAGDDDPSSGGRECPRRSRPSPGQRHGPRRAAGGRVVGGALLCRAARRPEGAHCDHRPGRGQRPMGAIAPWLLCQCLCGVAWLQSPVAGPRGRRLGEPCWPRRDADVPEAAVDPFEDRASWPGGDERP